MKKYLWLSLPLAVFVAVIIYCCLTLRPAPDGKKTTEAIVQLDQLVKSQDKAVTRVYTSVVKEVREKDAEIGRTVKALSPDVVAVSLDALLSEYRRERDAGN